MTTKFDRFEAGREIENPVHRTMYFTLAGDVYSRRMANMGFASEDRCHELALIALHSVDWKSMKAAKALMTVTRMW